MHPVLVRIGQLTFYTYGLMLGLGFAAGVYVASKRAEKRGMDPDSLFWFFIAILVGGVAGGRITHVALNYRYYTGLLSVLDTREGGLAIHGVLIGGSLAALVYSRVKKMHFLTLMDVVAPSVALGQGIGRIGCFFSGCCYGIKTSGTWGFQTRYAPGLRHPYQLYESVLDLALFAALLYLSSRIRAPGGLFVVYAGAYSLIRFFLEFFRENDDYFYGLSFGQWFSLVTVVLATATYIGLHRKSRAP
ncbi:MAG: prolipoprotein diacylglyceryl transferase [Bacillota bacterium]|nr:prolipoprotein diacylglyceryl transferase [Candidatus Fermentithermobacillaceae bacterium]